MASARTHLAVRTIFDIHMRSLTSSSLFRYLRLIINLVAHWTYKPIRPLSNPSLNERDVTIIIPSITGDDEELRRTVRSCLASGAHKVILVTIHTSLPQARRLSDAMCNRRLQVLSVANPNKRRQVSHAIPHVSTKITILADDDVVWPNALLQWILSPFEHAEMGGVGTSQRLIRPKKTSLWSFLASLYLERRNYDCSACLHMDGGLPCLSGRTVAYRTSILQDPSFLEGFTNERWCGQTLNADDDNFITRWVYSHGWQIAMQYHKACEVKTTLEDGPRYLNQCLRWARSNWRSNLNSMFIDRQCWWYVLDADCPRHRH